MKKIKKYALFFIIGAIGYGAIEMIWRGYTHWTMLIAGGLCFVIFSLVARFFKEKNIFLKAAICAACVTAVEFLFGIIFNIILHMNVWDYSNLPLNVLGQICPLYSVLWIGVAIIMLPFADALNSDYETA